MKDSIGLSELRVRLAEVMRQVEGTGATVLVTDRGRAIARLAPLEPARPEPAPAPPVATPVRAEGRRPWPAAALRSLLPSSIDERQLVGVYELPTPEGGVAPCALSISFHVCPKCYGRGRSVRVGLDGAPVPEEMTDLQVTGYQFLDPCDRCEGKRVVPLIDTDHLDDRTRHGLLKASWFLERIEADLAPFLPQEEPPIVDDPGPGFCHDLFREDDVLRDDDVPF